jgi:hypothetical protein
MRSLAARIERGSQEQKATECHSDYFFAANVREM